MSEADKALSGGEIKLSGRRIRLEGIDAPETAQLMGPEAKAALKEAISGRELEIEIVGKDRHGRDLAIVKMPDGRSVQDWLIERGLAVFDENYYKPVTNEDWLKSQRKARESRLGFWATDNAELPWDYRKRTKN